MPFNHRALVGVSQGMRRAIPWIAALMLAAPAWPQTLVLDIDSWLEWPDSLFLRARVSEGSSRLFFACSTSGCLTGEGGFGLSLPLVRLGPLAQAGLLREIANPLGFSAGSGVFSERTGLSLDASFPLTETGICLLPIPQSLGLFLRQTGMDDGLAMGCYARLSPFTFLDIEGVVSASEPRAGGPSEDWYLPSPRFPGGRILVTAGRALFQLSPVSLCLTLGCSAAQMPDTGAFWHAHASYESNTASISLFAGGADPAYLTPAGKSCGDCLAAGSRLLIASGVGSLDLGFSFALAQPGFTAQGYRESRESVSLGMERVLAGQGRRHSPKGALSGDILVGRIGAEKSTQWDEEGGRSETASCFASLAFHRNDIEASIRASLDRSGGPGFLLSVVCMKGRSRICVKAGWEGSDSNLPGLFISCSARLDLGERVFNLSAGSSGLSWNASPSFALKAGWGVGSVFEAPGAMEAEPARP